jgi:hypothetical protein
MHYVTRGSHQIQKHKFSVTCTIMLFVETTPGPQEHEKYCIHVSRPGCTRKHYKSHRSDQVQKPKLRVTCPSALSIESVPVAPSIKNSASMFHGPEAPECTT